MAEQFFSHRAHQQMLYSGAAMSAQNGKINLLLAHKALKLFGRDP